MRYKIIFAIVATVVITGCEKINGPDHSALSTAAVFSTSRDLDNLLYGAYSAVAGENALAGYWKVFPEILADHVIINVTEQLPADPYVQLYNRNMQEAQYAQSWKMGYTAIQNANCILYAIDNKIISKGTDSEFTDYNRDRIKGEALFLRALAYFELVRLYGHQYGFNSAATNSGIILRTLPTLDVTNIEQIRGQGRASVEEVYKLIISDLQNAELLMPPPSASSRRGRASNYAAAAILARVYFQMNDYAKALLQINKVIGITPGMIETSFGLVRSPATGPITAAQANANVLAAFNSSSTSTPISENIFDLISVANSPVNGVINRKYWRTATIEPHLAISTTFITEAGFAANDGRKANLITTVGAKNYTKKFDRSLMNIPVIRSAELVLDRAEINAMNAATNAQAHAAAIADLNLIRDRAIPSYVPATVTSITAANILAEVRRERIRELAFEGDRLHNLKRMQANVGPGNRPGVQPLPWNSNKLLFKIPEAEIKTGTNIVQNPD